VQESTLYLLVERYSVQNLYVTRQDIRGPRMTQNASETLRDGALFVFLLNETTLLFSQ
jgi:hypothetical protein